MIQIRAQMPERGGGGLTHCACESENILERISSLLLKRKIWVWHFWTCCWQMLPSPALQCHWKGGLPCVNLYSASNSGSARTKRGVPPRCHISKTGYNGMYVMPVCRTFRGPNIPRTGRPNSIPSASLLSLHRGHEPLQRIWQPVSPQCTQARGRGQHGPCSCHALPELTLAFATGINGICFDPACAAAADRVFLAVIAVPLVGLLASILYALRPVDKDQVHSASRS